MKCRKKPLGNLTGTSLMSWRICACVYDIVISWDNHISLCACHLLGIKIPQDTNLTLAGFHYPIIGILLLMNIKLYSKNITMVYIQGLQKQTEILLVIIIPSCWSRIILTSSEMSAQVQFWLLSTAMPKLPFHITFKKCEVFRTI